MRRKADAASAIARRWFYLTLGLMVVLGQPKTHAEYIQATSRVGRGKTVGLIVVIYNNNKTRDRAHYESFATWHSTLYREVDSTSVTPFAPRARRWGR